ncbi:unnamed protein product [Heligmosomoides polygyrus]|uniref:HTH psq-type domain-containing protein n=1 Tax=Heligmosomoides polygyrus TaxID=6339 RepID=A0A183G8K2_HELPZ|nr:unnamed protein product [Heligmosomoides polygyrus]
MRKMASELNVSATTMKRVAKNELGLYPYKFHQLHGQTPAQMEGRRKKPPRLLERHDHYTTLFTDKKLFSIEQHFDRRNSRLLAESGEDADTVNRNSYAASLMVWAGVCATRWTRLVFVEKGAKVNTNVYLNDIVMKELVP